MNYNCGIIDDLLPLYLDGACSEESTIAIEMHLKGCDVCRNKLTRMKADNVISEVVKADSEITMAKYAKKVKRHRIKLAIGAVVVSVAAALVLFLVFLTVKDMHNLANPTIYQVETDVYNLTANDLVVAAAEIDDYVFFTNNTKIEVSAEKSTDTSGEVLLWNVDDRNDPQTIGYGEITPDKTSCTFSNLSAVHRYMVTWDGNKEMILTVTDGRKVSFFGSMKNVLEELFYMMLES